MKVPSQEDKKNFQDAMQALQGDRPEEALRLFEKAEINRPNDPDILYLKCLAHGRLGDVLSVVKCSEQALQVNPKHFGALSCLANAQMVTDKHEEALENYAKALEASPDDPTILSNYGRALSMMGRRDEAISIFERVLKVQPGSSFAHLGLAEAYKAGGFPQKALEQFQKTLELDPNMPMAHLGMADLYAGLGGLNMLDFHYKRALELEPRLEAGYIGLSTIALQAGRPDEAMEMIDKADAIDDGKNPGIMTARANIFEKSGREDEAWEIIQLLKKEYGLNSNAVKIMTNICRKFDACDESLEYIDELLEMPSVTEMDRQQLRYASADLLDNLGRYDAAFEKYEAANASISARYRGKEYYDRLAAMLSEKFTKEIKDKLPRATTGSSRPIFILGMPRSGTSLTEQILASHPDVYGAGELSHVRELAGAIKTELGRDEDLPYVAFIKDIDQNLVDQFAQEYLDRIGKLNTDARFVTDKMPGNFQFIGLIELLFPDARIISCRRHPLDNCLSIYFQNFMWSHDYAMDIRHVANYYNSYSKIIAHWQEVVDLPMLNVNYEATIEDPEGSARRILEFCGLEWDESVMDFHQSERMVATASYKQVRQPIYKTSRARWKNYESHLGPMIELLEDKTRAYDEEISKIFTS